MPQPTSPRSSAGFTLVELLVSMVIMVIGLLGLLQTVIIATERNLQNQLRDEAIQVGENSLNSMAVRPFAMLTTVSRTTQVPIKVRAFTKTYTVTQSLSDLGTESKQLLVDVQWGFKDTTYRHSVMTIKTK